MVVLTCHHQGFLENPFDSCRGGINPVAGIKIWARISNFLKFEHGTKK